MVDFMNEEVTGADDGLKKWSDAIGAITIPASEIEDSEDSETVCKRDPLAKYNELTEDRKDVVDGIVSSVLEKITTDGNVQLDLLLGVLDRLNAEKKSAKEAEKALEKERKEAEKAEAEKRAVELKEKIKPGDKIDYTMATNKVTIVQATVVKVTDKSARIDVNADSTVIFKGKTMKAGDLPSGILKLGMKSVAFAKVRNLTSVAVAA